MRNEWWLAIESSVPRTSVALARGGEVVFETEIEAGRKPSEVLMQPLQACLRHLASDDQLAAILIGRGPGSYNGVRVAIAAGQGTGLVHDCPTIGVCSLEGTGIARKGDPCLAIGDARRGTFFTIDLANGKLAGKTELWESEPFLERLIRAKEEGKSLLTLEDPGRLPLPEELMSEVDFQVPSATLLLMAWAAKTPTEREVASNIPAQPFYLRPPHITKAKG